MDSVDRRCAGRVLHRQAQVGRDGVSAFGVIMVGIGILAIWSTVHGQKISDVFKSFYSAPVKTAAYSTGNTQGSLA